MGIFLISVAVGLVLQALLLISDYLCPVQIHYSCQALSLCVIAGILEEACT